MPNHNDVPQLRIALHSPGLPSEGGANGIITYTRVMRDALRALGHEVMITTGERVEHFDGSVEELPPPSFWCRVRGRRLNDGFDQILNPFQVARRCGAQVFEMEEILGFAARLRGIPVVTRLHGPNAFCPDTYNPKQAEAEIESLGKVAAVTSPSAKLLDAVRERFDVGLPNATVIPNPMESLRQRWELATADPDQILFVGRFDKRKGADVAIEALAKARKQCPNLRMVMVGPGEPWMSIPPFVTVLGSQPPERIAELQLRSVLALSASRFETFSYVIAEAMSLGMPVLASDTFGPSEIIRDGIDGRLVPIADADATADAIIEMLSDPTTLAKIGEAAALRVSEYMSPARIADETAKLYSRVVRGGIDASRH